MRTDLRNLEPHHNAPLAWTDTTDCLASCGQGEGNNLATYTGVYLGNINCGILDYCVLLREYSGDTSGSRIFKTKSTH